MVSLQYKSDVVDPDFHTGHTNIFSNCGTEAVLTD